MEKKRFYIDYSTKKFFRHLLTFWLTLISVPEVHVLLIDNGYRISQGAHVFELIRGYRVPLGRVSAWPSPLSSFEQRDSNKRENNIIHRNKNRDFVCAENPRWKLVFDECTSWNANHFPRLPLPEAQPH